MLKIRTLADAEQLEETQVRRLEHEVKPDPRRVPKDAPKLRDPEFFPRSLQHRSKY